MIQQHVEERLGAVERDVAILARDVGAFRTSNNELKTRMRKFTQCKIKRPEPTSRKAILSKLLAVGTGTGIHVNILSVFRDNH